MNLQDNNRTESELLSQAQRTNNQSSTTASNQNVESSTARRTEHGAGDTTSSLLVPSSVISSSSSSAVQVSRSSSSGGVRTNTSTTSAGRGRGRGRGQGRGSNRKNVNHHERQRSVSTGSGDGNDGDRSHPSSSTSRRDRSNSLNSSYSNSGGRNKNKKSLPITTTSFPQDNNRNANSLLNFHHVDTNRRELLSANSRKKKTLVAKQRPLSKHELESQRLERRARFKQASAFFLQTSSHHKFVLRRNHPFILQNQLCETKSKTPTSQHPTPYTKSRAVGGASDDSSNVINIVDMTNIPWEAIEFVKVLIELGHSTNHEFNSSSICPICLNELIAPRIIPCGHMFCLSCLLHHWFTSKTAASATDVKCPCCSVYVTDLQQLRPVILQSVTSPHVDKGTGADGGTSNGLIFQKLCTVKHHHHGNENEGGGSGASGSKTSPIGSSSNAGSTTRLSMSSHHHHHHTCRHGHSKQQQAPSQHPQRPVTVVHAEDTDAPQPILPSYSDKDSHYYRYMIQDDIPIVYSEILEHDLQMILLDTKELDEQKRLMVAASATAGVQACDTQQSFNQMAKDMIQLNLSQVRQTIQEASIPPRVTSDALFDHDFLEAPTTTKKSALASLTTTEKTTPSRSSTTALTTTLDTNTKHVNVSASASAMEIKDEWEDHLVAAVRVAEQVVLDHHNAEQTTSSTSKTTTTTATPTTTSSPSTTTKQKRQRLDENKEKITIEPFKGRDHGTTTPTSRNRAAFYQTNDGQLCFLSGFNMACLKFEAEIRLKRNAAALLEEQDNTNDGANDHDHDNNDKILSYLPLTIHGCTVVDVEKVHVSPHVRQHRVNFLHYHVPLYSDVYLVELDLFSSSHYLSEETKEHFREENELRKKKRRQKKAAEKKLDKKLSRKQSQDEEVQRRLRFGSSRPDFENDSFFHAAATPALSPDEQHQPLPLEEGFGPALSPTRATTAAPQQSAQPGTPSAASILFGRTQQQTTAAGQYNRVTASQGYYPDLASSMATLSLQKSKKKRVSNTSTITRSPRPAAASSSTTTTAGGAWGTTTTAITKASPVDSSSLITASLDGMKPTSTAEQQGEDSTATKKGIKKKGRSKVVLFSTGGGGGR